MQTSQCSKSRPNRNRIAQSTTCKLLSLNPPPSKRYQWHELPALHHGACNLPANNYKVLGLAVATASSWLALSCPPSLAGPALFTSVARQPEAEAVTFKNDPVEGLDVGRHNQGNIGQASKPAGVSLAGIISTADCLSAAAHDLVSIKTGNSDLHIADVAGRMSQQALALASEATQLMSVDLPDAERRLVEQITEAAQLVSSIADGIVAEEAERGHNTR